MRWASRGTQTYNSGRRKDHQRCPRRLGSGLSVILKDRQHLFEMPGRKKRTIVCVGLALGTLARRHRRARSRSRVICGDWIFMSCPDRWNGDVREETTYKSLEGVLFRCKETMCKVSDKGKRKGGGCKEWWLCRKTKSRAGEGEQLYAVQGGVKWPKQQTGVSERRTHGPLSAYHNTLCSSNKHS